VLSKGRSTPSSLMPSRRLSGRCEVYTTVVSRLGRFSSAVGCVDVVVQRCEDKRKQYAEVFALVVLVIRTSDGHEGMAFQSDTNDAPPSG
jgi:hypothetical protein